MESGDHLEILNQGVKAWNAWRRKNPDLRPDLAGANPIKAKLALANHNKTDFTGSCLMQADLTAANLSGAYLKGAERLQANLHAADLSWAHLREACLIEPGMSLANLSWADLRLASLGVAELSRADFYGLDLIGARLDVARCPRTSLAAAEMRKCTVYGICPGDVAIDEKTEQRDLIITPSDEPSITVDNLGVAQFIHLLLNNRNMRQVIDTITSKVVLILGRFTPERKVILDALREELRQRDRLPIIFDFDKPSTRDTHETITTLARMARFIIADITEPKSIPQELVSNVEHLPCVAVQPILQKGSEPWGMYDHIARYPWVLSVVRYTMKAALVARLDDLVIAPAEAKVREIRGELSTKRQ